MKAAIIVHGGAGSGKYSSSDPRFLELRKSVESGLAAMKSGSALDGVEAAVRYMEESGKFNAGRGACLNSEGKVELDAAIMSAKGLAGAGVGSVSCTHHPVTLSRWVMENTKHVLIVGPRCRDYARIAGLDVEELRPSAAVLAKFKELAKDEDSPNLRLAQRLQDGNTVGAVAIGSDGVAAAAVSTGGMWLKLPGRVGDSAIIGSGIFADKSGAACATGTGEEIIRTGLSSRACEYLGSLDAESSAKKAIGLITRLRGKNTAGIITVDAKGRVGASYNTEAMGRAWYDGKRERVSVLC